MNIPLIRSKANFVGCLINEQQAKIIVNDSEIDFKLESTDIELRNFPDSYIKDNEWINLPNSQLKYFYDRPDQRLYLYFPVKEVK